MKSLYFSSFLLIIISSGIVNISALITFEEDVTLTLKQKEKLQQFKRKVVDHVPHGYMKSDLYLLKWLRTSYFDLKSAETRLMNDLAWREENKMDTIHLEDFSDLKDEFHYSIDGRDKYGRSFLYISIGDMDLRRAILQGKLERIERYKDQAIEVACSLVRELGIKYANITRGSLIVNVEGFNVVQHSCLRCVPFLLKIVTAYQQHYPECADELIAVNTPAIAEPLINLGRPLISKELSDSLRLYGTNKKQWMKALEKDFDSSQLPPELGGTKEDH